MSTEMSLLYACCRRQRRIGEDVAVHGIKWHHRQAIPPTSSTEHVIVTMHVSRQRESDD